MYKIGIDVGGTNTDAVLTDENNKIISRAKLNTSLDILEGINNALVQLLENSNVNKNEIKYAMLGTTQCTNAIVERKNLNKVLVIRIAGYATRGILPTFDWPQDIISETLHSHHLIDGGYEFDGKQMTQLDLSQVDEILINNPDINNFAISCVNSPIDKSDENTVKEHILKSRPDANISLSNEIGSFNLIERENATILNSSLNSVIKNVVNGFSQALKQNDLDHVSFYLCQNDGTIMKLENALTYPIFTISSGPTNSIRGAVKLADVNDAIIVDVGGTTTDIGVLQKGLARESHGTTAIGGVSTNFRMPDMISLAIGGGTIIRINEDNTFSIGPDSVGYNLLTKALVFGGDTLTLTDIAVRLNRAEIGDPKLVEHLDIDFCKAVDKEVNIQIRNAIDLLKLSDAAVEVIFVGGGCVVINEDIFENDNVLIPDNYEVANAFGATIAQVSGYHEGLYELKNKVLEEQLELAKNRAIAETIKAGAQQEGIEIVDFEQSQVNYHPNNAFIYKVKAIGNLNFE